MRINITVIKTNLKTNEAILNDFVFYDDDWNPEEIEIPSVTSKRMLTTNEELNAFVFLYEGFGEQLKLSRNLDIHDFEFIFPVYTATDSRKKKRGYIFQIKEMEGIQTRIILIAPNHYLSKLL